MPRGKKSSGGGGKYTSEGYITSTGRLYTSKPGPKGSTNNNFNINSSSGINIGSGYLTSTGRIYKSKPGPKSSYPKENDSYSFSNGYLTSTGRLYKSKPGPKSKNDNKSDLSSLTNVLDNLSLLSNSQNIPYPNNNNNNVYYFERPFEPLRVRPENNQVNNFYNRDLDYNNNHHLNDNFGNNNNQGNLNILDNNINFNLINDQKNKNNEKDELNIKIKKYRIKIIISDDYIKENKSKKEKNKENEEYDNEEEEEEDEEEKEEEKEEKENENKNDEESNYFSESFKSLPKDSFDSTIIKLKNDLSSAEAKETYNSENDTKKKKEESESGNVVKGGKYEKKECIICIKHFKKKEKLGMLKCDHCFHINCIINWFDAGKKECPLCKKKQIN